MNSQWNNTNGSHIREIMFDTDMYDSTMVSNLMILPPAYIGFNDTMKDVIDKFRSLESASNKKR